MANKKVFWHLSEYNDVWGGWESATDYGVWGYGGNDTLYGYVGNDTLSGDAGDDEIYGSLGDDSLLGGEGRDRLFGGEGNDKIEGGANEDEVFGGQGHDEIEGGSGHDQLFGGTGDDTLEGNDGNDTLYGENGQDVLFGNEGNDSIHGGAGNDVLFGNANADALFGNEGEDYLSGDSGSDHLYGGDDSDTLVGGTGSDHLYGEAGDDTLIGVLIDESGANGSGSNGSMTLGINTVDTLIGGAGQDTFVLGDATTVFYDDGDAQTAGENDYALIKDFNRFEDTILLQGSASDYVVAALPASLESAFSHVITAGLYRDSNGSGIWDETDELIAVVEQIDAKRLVLESGYFQFTDVPERETWHPATDAGWELVFSDDFDSTALDSQLWNTRYAHNVYGGRTNPWNAEHQAYVGDNEVIDGVTYDAFEFDDGVLSIVAQRLAQPITLAVNDSSAGFDPVKTFEYTSGLITSEDNVAFTYGYMEIRAQVAAGQSLWPAFWTLPTTGGWPPEIDIMESLGHRTDTVFNSLHSTDAEGGIQLDVGEQTFSEIDFSADFHTYGVKWTAEALTWFVDDQALFTVDHDIPDVSMYLLANMAVGGYWPGSPDETTPETSAFKIDYIRVYQDGQGTLHGGSQDDVLSKAFGHLSGEAGNDSLLGGKGDNTLLGGAGDDLLFGTDTVNAGVGEIDTLLGGSGADVFVLGELGQVFYDDGDVTMAGRGDYALIQDFAIAQDTIQLVGSAANYRLGTAADQLSTELWLDDSSVEGELIAVLNQTMVSGFESGFAFVA